MFVIHIINYKLLNLEEFKTAFYDYSKKKSKIVHIISNIYEFEKNGF